MKRVMVSITPELEKGLDNLKREKFYDKPYAEVYRYVFSLGLKAEQEKEKMAEKENYVMKEGGK